MTAEEYKTWAKLLNPIVKQLTRIADSLDRLTTEPEPEPESLEPPTCPHPVESRIDFGITNGKPDWQCGIPTCGFRTETE